jgi:hypothetical protein
VVSADSTGVVPVADLLADLPVAVLVSTSSTNDEERSTNDEKRSTTDEETA